MATIRSDELDHDAVQRVTDLGRKVTKKKCTGYIQRAIGNLARSSSISLQLLMHFSMHLLFQVNGKKCKLPWYAQSQI